MKVLDELESKAKAATPGPWLDTRGSEMADYRPIRCLAFGIPADSPRDVTGADIALVTACDPQTVLALVEVVRAAATMREVHREGANTVADNTFDAALAKLEGGKP